MTEDKDKIKGAVSAETEGVSKSSEDKPAGSKPVVEKPAKAAPTASEKKLEEAAKADPAKEGKAAAAPKKPPAKKAAPKPKKEEPPPLGLIVSSSPHLLTEESVPKIMHNVVMALVPAMIASIYIFGYRAAVLLITCVVASIITEAVFQKARKQQVTVYDGSAIITGLLLALTLPPSFPIHGAILGSVFAIAIGKQIFGGLGYNIFNPALLGRAFLQATYPVLITTWSEPFVGAVDAVSSATPLALMKFEAEFAPLGSLFMGNVAGSLGETSVIAILIGGLYLRYKGYNQLEAASRLSRRHRRLRRYLLARRFFPVPEPPLSYILGRGDARCVVYGYGYGDEPCDPEGAVDIP